MSRASFGSFVGHELRASCGLKFKEFVMTALHVRSRASRFVWIKMKAIMEHRWFALVTSFALRVD